MADTVKYTDTQRGNRLALYNGYMFTKHLSRPLSTMWRCKDRSCKGKIYIDNQGIVVHQEDHHHLPSLEKVTAEELKVKIKKRAADTLEKPRQIVSYMTAKIDIEVTNLLPKYQSTSRVIQRTRKANAVQFPTPLTLSDIVITGHFGMTHRESPFLIHDSGKDDLTRIIVFGTEGNLNILNKADTWLGDGTFKVAPELFLQLYTIHGLVHGAVVPLVYALLPNKTEVTYRKLFSALRDNIEALRYNIDEQDAGYNGPHTMIIDFEKGAIQGFQHVFCNTKLQGCMFHLGQSIYRKMSSLGLSEQYLTDTEFKRQCKMMWALAFVPEADVLAAWKLLCQMDGRTFDVNSELHMYFAENYVSGSSRTRANKRGPLYAIEFWNCNGRVVAGDPRTTNNLESWHQSFQSTVDCHHPSVYKLFEQIRTEQNFQEIRLGKLSIGDTPAKPKRKYQATQDRLVELIGRYNKMDKLQFLRSIAGNLEMNL